jgi:hypothetical protein
LGPGITALSPVEALNMLNSTQLNKFNIELDNGGQVSKLTLGEKWEGMSLVSANDPANPFDYFLFIANDNDFLTSSGTMIGPGGGPVAYNGFNNTSTPYPANRIPGAVGDAVDPVNFENDTMFLVYRVTVVPEPGSVALMATGALGLGLLGWRRRWRAA